jgi:hypothetical protein
MTVKGNHQRQADRRLRGADGDGKTANITPVSAFGVRAETPEGDEIQIRRVEHQLHADQHQDRVAARQRAGQADAKEQGGQDQIMEWRAQRCSSSGLE